MPKFFIYTLILSAQILSVFVLSACSSTLSVKPDNSKKPEAAKLIKSLMDREKEIKSVEAEGKLDIKTEKRHDKISITWIIEKPKSALFEISGPTGLLGLAVMNEKDFQYLNMPQKTVYFGENSSENLSMLIPWSLEVQDLMSILSGTPKMIKPKGYRLDYSKKTDRWALTIKNSDGWKQIWTLHGDGQVYNSTLIDDKGAVHYDVTYLRWEKRGESGLPYPGYIKLDHPPSKSVIILKGSDIKVNGKLDASIFTPEFPKNLQWEKLGF